MWTVRGEIADALKKLKLPTSQLRQLDSKSAQEIIRKTMLKYVEGRPRVWWLSLKMPFESHYYDFPSNQLYRYIKDKESKCYWIPEIEEEELLVFEVKIDCIFKIRELTPRFEYYVVGKNINWLLIETDHSELIFINE